MKIHPVVHMDEVLRLALAHENPEEFLVRPTEVIDWRIAIQTDKDRPQAH
jgi:hypothetical protein